MVAGLQHPGIIPVYDAGTLPDGRRYFTMKEIVGVTFGQVIGALHRDGSDTHWPAPGSPWTLRRVMERFQRVCEATGHAHRTGVFHRDLSLREQEIRNIEWIANCIEQGQKQRINQYLPIFAGAR